MRRLILRSLLACTLALPHFASAHDGEDFDKRVRAYLLNNPEVILEALETLSARQAEAETAQKLAAYPEIFGNSALGLGETGAPNQVVEFFDYRCGPCKAVHPKLVALVEDNPALRFDMRQLPILSPGSERAARFALATELVAGEEAYAAVHEALWGQRGPLNEAGFQRIAGDLGLDFSVIKAEMHSAAVDAEIGRNRDMAIDLGILGTPAFVTRTSVKFGSTDLEALAEGWLSQ